MTSSTTPSKDRLVRLLGPFHCVCKFDRAITNLLVKPGENLLHLAHERLTFRQRSADTLVRLAGIDTGCERGRCGGELEPSDALCEHRNENGLECNAEAQNEDG